MKITALGLLGSLLLAAPMAGRAQTPPAEEAMGTVAGREIARQNGGYVGLQIVNGNFRLDFYNAKRKPVPVDVARGTARWDSKQKLGRDFTVMNPSEDGRALVGNKFVRPPLNFIVFITLLDAGGQVVESFQVNLLN